MTTLRDGHKDDLPAINGIITGAIGTWSVSDRVKRLSLPLYHYQPDDFDHLTFLLAIEDGEPVAVAAFEPAEPHDLPAGMTGWLLHGLYVTPRRAHGGLGSLLLNACRERAAASGCDGVVVKATRDAVGFFERAGLQRLPVLDEERDYALRYWLPIDASV